MTTIQAETSQCMFEFLHMEIVSQIQQEVGPNKKGEVMQRLEALGHRVGESLVERASRDHPRFKNELDAVVFACKQFWMSAFNKNIDNLKTNHQDTYVLHDNAFRLIQHISEGNQYRDEAQTYLSFACGLLAGALSNVGIKCQVSAEIVKMPACIFQIKVLL